MSRCNNISKSKKGGKDQESIQSSTTPDPGYHMRKRQNPIKHHKQQPRGQPPTVVGDSLFVVTPIVVGFSWLGPCLWCCFMCHFLCSQDKGAGCFTTIKFLLSCGC